MKDQRKPPRFICPQNNRSHFTHPAKHLHARKVTSASASPTISAGTGHFEQIASHISYLISHVYAWAQTVASWVRVDVLYYHSPKSSIRAVRDTLIHTRSEVHQRRPAQTHAHAHIFLTSTHPHPAIDRLFPFFLCAPSFPLRAIPPCLAAEYSTVANPHFSSAAVDHPQNFLLPTQNDISRCITPHHITSHLITSHHINLITSISSLHITSIPSHQSWKSTNVGA
jgi:hypothetical protein